MASRIAQWTLDVQDVDRMAEFWAGALDLRVERGDDGAAKLYPRDGAGPDVPTVWLQPTAPAKTGKNRLHLDLRPVGGDVEAEGNELCVLRNEPRRVQEAG